MPESLIQKVASYCWSNKFLDVFRKYFEDHGPMFADAPEMTGGEHNMEYFELFQDYLKVYENTLTDYLKTIDCTVEELYREVRETQAESTDPYMKMFIDCLLASADYDSFYKVMLREGKKCKANSVAKKNVNDAPSEAKGGGGGGDNAKGSRDADLDRADSKSWSEDRSGGDEGKKSEGKFSDEK